MDIRVLNNVKLTQLGLSDDDAHIISLQRFGYEDLAKQMIEIKKQNDSYILSELNNLFHYNIDTNEKTNKPEQNS